METERSRKGRQVLEMDQMKVMEPGSEVDEFFMALPRGSLCEIINYSCLIAQDQI